MSNPISYIIKKELLDVLCASLEQLAAKIGLNVAHHGSKDLIARVRSTLIVYNEDEPILDKENTEVKK
jgi:hypothetical protein